MEWKWLFSEQREASRKGFQDLVDGDLSGLLV